VISARLGEARVYRRMFLAGLGGFTVASLACGWLPRRWWWSSPGLRRARRRP